MFRRLRPSASAGRLIRPRAARHDGSASDLFAVVDHYGGFFGLGLAAKQKADLVEFLKSI